MRAEGEGREGGIGVQEGGRGREREGRGGEQREGELIVLYSMYFSQQIKFIYITTRKSAERKQQREIAGEGKTKKKERRKI